MLVIGVVGSPSAGGRTRVAVDAVLGGAGAQGADTRVLELAEVTHGDVLAALDAADRAEGEALPSPPPGDEGFRLALEERLRGQSDPAAAMACAAELLGLGTRRDIWAYRVPSLLGALLAVLATYSFGRGLVGRRPALLGLLGLAVVCTVGAIGAFFAGLRRVGPTTASILATGEPVVTVALAL